uniref:TNF superfamily member 12 n=1 Tax=Homo sapiens TaxID=9606 RepID=A0A8V8TPL4_HUMAN
MAARRSQRRRGRRGEPGTALLVPLALGLGLALACLGLLLAVVSLGSRASLSAQQEPAQEELVAEEDQDPSVSGRGRGLQAAGAWEVCTAEAAGVCSCASRTRGTESPDRRKPGSCAFPEPTSSASQKCT